jgi:hypothetical protein
LVFMRPTSISRPTLRSPHNNAELASGRNLRRVLNGLEFWTAWAAAVREYWYRSTECSAQWRGLMTEALL